MLQQTKKDICRKMRRSFSVFNNKLLMKLMNFKINYQTGS